MDRVREDNLVTVLLPDVRESTAESEPRREPSGHLGVRLRHSGVRPTIEERVGTGRTCNNYSSYAVSGTAACAQTGADGRLIDSSRRGCRAYESRLSAARDLERIYAGRMGQHRTARSVALADLEC